MISGDIWRLQPQTSKFLEVQNRVKTHQSLGIIPLISHQPNLRSNFGRHAPGNPFAASFNQAWVSFPSRLLPVGLSREPMDMEYVSVFLVIALSSLNERQIIYLESIQPNHHRGNLSKRRRGKL